MQLTLEEREREAYRDGNTDLANAIGKVIDLQNYIAELHAAAEDAEKTIQHLKRILRDALADDCWRGRAAAAIEDEC